MPSWREEKVRPSRHWPKGCDNAYEFIIGPLLENPHRVGKRLRPPLDDRHGAHRGTYRVIFRSDIERHVVAVVAVVHRADAYRPE
jgi:mRNA-degrading endonuclease RelE of RelBE toxin-antitoxin system